MERNRVLLINSKLTSSCPSSLLPFGCKKMKPNVGKSTWGEMLWGQRRCWYLPSPVPRLISIVLTPSWCNWADLWFLLLLGYWQSDGVWSLRRKPLANLWGIACLRQVSGHACVQFVIPVFIHFVPKVPPRLQSARDWMWALSRILESTLPVSDTCSPFLEFRVLLSFQRKFDAYFDTELFLF